VITLVEIHGLAFALPQFDSFLLVVFALLIFGPVHGHSALAVVVVRIDATEHERKRIAGTQHQIARLQIHRGG
jgi:hypothetical protein